MNATTCFFILYSVSCVYNAYVYTYMIERHNELSYRLFVLFLVLLGPVTSVKLLYWQVQSWIKIRSFRRYLRSPQFRTDVLNACNKLGIEIEGGNTIDNLNKMDLKN